MNRLGVLDLDSLYMSLRKTNSLQTINIKTAVQQTGEHHIFLFFSILMHKSLQILLCFKSAALPLLSYWGKKTTYGLTFELRY